MNKQELQTQVAAFLNDDTNRQAIAGMTTAAALATGNVVAIAAVAGLDFALYQQIKK